MTGVPRTVSIGGSPGIEISVRRSTRARRVSLRVSAGRAELVVPAGASERRAREFAESNAAWIVRKLEESRAHAGPVPAAAGLPGMDVLASEGARFPYRGAIGVVRVEIGDDRRIRVEKDGCFVVHAPAGATAVSVEKALRVFLDGELESVFRMCQARFLAETGRTAAGLRFRDMKTLWGSCSASGMVTLNRQLSRLPVGIVEYTSYHELCHILVKGHGREFWSLLAGLVPDCRSCMDYLRKCR